MVIVILFNFVFVLNIAYFSLPVLLFIFVIGDILCGSGLILFCSSLVYLLLVIFITYYVLIIIIAFIPFEC